MHLIRFPNAKERERAIGALLDVPREYVVLPGPQYVVSQEHIKALEQAKVHFTYLSHPRHNGKRTTRVQP